MKKYFLLITLLILQITIAQAVTNLHAVTPLTSSVEVTLHKTTSLVFPYDIISVDRGSSGIIIKKAGGVSNVLQVKANQAWFDETNLTIITADARIYGFTVNYSEDPTKFIHDFTQPLHKATRTPRFNRPRANLVNRELNDAELKMYAEKVARSRSNIHRIGQKRGGVKLRVESVQSKKNVNFYKIRLDNHSHLRYDIDFIRFYIKDWRGTRRIATQEIEITPLYLHGYSNKSITGKKSKILVVALGKVTLGPGKQLVMEVFERKGARNLVVKLKNKHLIKASPISHLYN